MNRFKIQNLSLWIMLIISFGIFSNSAFSKTIYADVSNHTTVEPAMVMSGKSHLRKVQGVILSITGDSIFIFNRGTNSKQNYIINNGTRLYNHRLYHIARSSNGREKIIEIKKSPNFLRKGYIVILGIIPGSNIVKSIKIVEKPR